MYWTGQFVKNPTQPRNGITTADYQTGGVTIPEGSFVDPWGHFYLVWVDANHDGDLSTAVGWFYQNVKPGSVHPGDPPLSLEIGSIGPDGKFGKNGDGILAGSDDIVTW